MGNPSIQACAVPSLHPLHLALRPRSMLLYAQCVSGRPRANTRSRHRCHVHACRADQSCPASLFRSPLAASRKAHEPQVTPGPDELPAVFRVGLVADHDRRVLVPDPALVRRAVRCDLLDDGHRVLVHALDRRLYRRPLDQRGEALRRVPYLRRDRAVLCADGRQPDHDVLGHAAQHGVLHADHRAGDHGRVFGAQG